jgi:tetratricopeptide (TPR) repeat protein
VLQDKGDLDGAIAEYREAIRLDPKFSKTHYGLGNALRDTGDPEGAIAEFRQAILLDPKFAMARTNLGNLLRAKGDWERALLEYRLAVSLDPKVWQAHNGLGNTLKAKGDLDGAIVAYREAIRLDPKFAMPQNNLGIALMAKGDLDGAIVAYREAIRLDPKYALPRNNLAWLLATCTDGNLRDPSRAVDLAKEAAQLDPNNANFFSTLGVAHYRAGDWQAAAAALKKSTQLRNGRNAPHLLFLAMAQWQLGNKAEAGNWYNKAVEWMDKNKSTDAEFHRFRAEAAELLGVKEKKD